MDKVVFQQDPNLPRAIIVDVDGTLCKMNGRQPFEWDRVDEDIPNDPVINLVHMYDGKVIFLSGRDGCCALKTINWIHTHTDIKLGIDTGNHQLIMRTPGDNRKDSIVKRELFDAHIRGKYFIDFVLDDRNQVVDMWRNEIGLPCFQVDYGDF